ncbi:hypothetical protein LCGC14_0622130, partial [marine sediment metagenome]
TGWGGIVNGGLGTNFLGCTFDSNGGGGLKLGSVAIAGDNLVSTKITHSYFENNTGKQLLIGDSAIVTNVIQDTKINNNFFLIDDTMISIYVDKASGTRIRDNTYRHGSGTINHIEITSNANATVIEEGSNSFWSANFVDNGANTVIVEDLTSEGVWAIRGTNPVLGIKGIPTNGTNYLRMYTSDGTIIGEIRQVYSGGVPKMVFNAKHSTGVFGFEINGTERAGIVKNGSFYSYKIGNNSITWGAAAPADGTWVVGDICWNTGVAAGGSPGWVCTSAGTPGTWKTMANVGA